MINSLFYFLDRFDFFPIKKKNENMMKLISLHEIYVIIPEARVYKKYNDNMYSIIGFVNNWNQKRHRKSS